MAQQSVPRKIPRPASPKPHDYADAIHILAPNSDTSSQSHSILQTQSQLRQPQADNEDAQALLLGIMLDLKGAEYPFLDILRVRKILERTCRLR